MLLYSKSRTHHQPRPVQHRTQGTRLIGIYEQHPVAVRAPAARTNLCPVDSGRQQAVQTLGRTLAQSVPGPYTYADRAQPSTRHGLASNVRPTG